MRTDSYGDRSPAPDGTDGELDLRAVGRAVWRRKGLIIGTTILAAAIAFVVVNVMTPKYKSEARILIEGRENIFLRPEAEKTVARNQAPDAEMVTSQVQLVLSRDLAYEAINQLKLEDRPEFDPLLRPVSLPFAILRLTGLLRDPHSMTAEERVLDVYYKNLNAFAIDKTRVLAIEFQSADPKLAAQAANTIASDYLSRLQSTKQDQTRAAGQFLEGEIAKLRKRVAEAEAKVEAFRSKSNLLVGTNNTTLSNQQLGEFNTQLSTARVQKGEAEARAKLIRDTLRSGQPIESSDILNSDLIRRLSEQRVTLLAQLAEQSSTLLSRHPRIKELSAQIRDLDTQMRREAEQIARAFENDAKLSDARVAAMSASFDQLKRAAASTNEEDVQLRELQREAKAQRDLLESYLAKYREAAALDNIAATPAEARIISRAVVSNTPASPKKLPIIAIVSLATFFLMTGLVTTGALLGGDAYRQPDRVTPTARKPLRRLPAAPIGDVTETIADATSSLDDIAAAIKQGGLKRLALVGAERDIGTTLTAIALARKLSHDQRVVLVDLAFASPNLSVVSNEPDAPGLADLMRGDAQFSTIITRDRYSSVHLVAAGRLEDDGDTILASDQLPAAIAALARSYECVLVDAGVASDALIEAMTGFMPGAVLVVADADDPAVTSKYERLLAAGFAGVLVTTGHRGGDASAAA